MANLEVNQKLQRLESYQYPHTHLGHLNPEQEGALAKFKQLCQAKKYYTAAGPGGRPAASHDDETLLRYLRARKWSPEDAFVQFKDTEDWRKENQLDKLYESIDIQEYEQSRRPYPQWTGRRDRRGIPVYVFEVAPLNSKTIAAHETSKSHTAVSTKVPPKMMRLFALYENLTTFVMPLCSALPDRAFPETPVSQSNNIVDISKVGLKQFWSLKSHMQDASTLATAHYPETLDRIFIIGAPSFFPTVWGWIKRWFDPITVSKIFILSHADMKKTLEQYIAPEDIPKKYGGQLDYEFGQLPNLDPLINQSLKWSHPFTENGHKTIPTGPIRWQREANGDMVALAVGSEGGRPRRTEVASLPSSGKPVQSSLGVPGRGRNDLSMYRTTSGLDTHPESPPPGTEEMSPPRSDSDAGAPAAGTVAEGATFGAAAAAGASSIPYRSAGQNQSGSTGEPQYASAGQSQYPPTGASQYQSAGQSQYSSAGKSQYLSGGNDEYSSAGQSQYPSTKQSQHQSTGEHQTAPDRQGTSSTRYEQQNATVASGQLAAGTPAMRSSGDGDKHGVMDPHTVAQAPKEYPVPEPEVPQPSYVDQAKDLAGSAYASAAGVAGAAMSAVGMGKEGEKVEESAQDNRIRNDPAVDQAGEKNVEEFLRSQYRSPAAGGKKM